MTQTLTTCLHWAARPGSTEHLDVMGRLIPMLHTAGLLTDDLTDLRTAPASQGKQGAGLSTPSPAQSERVVAYMGICLKGGLHRRIDIRCYPEYQEASALLHFTGSGQFNRFMSRAANDRGFTLSEFGLQPSIKVSHPHFFGKALAVLMLCERRGVRGW